MTEKDIFADRGRSLEEDYFRKKDRELIEKMREAAAAELSRQEMGARTGLTDPELLKDLQDLGFTPDTLVLLPLVPVIQMAWAEGGITAEERTMLISVARKRGIAPGSEADRQLAAWMDNRPDESAFTRARRLIAAILAAGGQTDINAEDLVKYCESIAYASGGFLGIGRISSEERALLDSIAAELRTRHR